MTGVQTCALPISKEKTSAGENDTLICMVRVFFWGGGRGGRGMWGCLGKVSLSGSQQRRGNYLTGLSFRLVKMRL